MNQTPEDDPSDTTAVEGPASVGDGEDGLLSRLRVIEDQPLVARARAYAQIFDELQQQLDEGAPVGRG